MKNLLDRIYRIYQIFSQFPEETEKEHIRKNQFAIAKFDAIGIQETAAYVKTSAGQGMLSQRSEPQISSTDYMDFWDLRRSLDRIYKIDTISSQFPGSALEGSPPRRDETEKEHIPRKIANTDSEKRSPKFRISNTEFRIMKF